MVHVVGDFNPGICPITEPSVSWGIGGCCHLELSSMHASSAREAE